MMPLSRLFAVQDQSDALSNLALKGIEYMERIGNFAKERAAIEDDYAAKLRALARKSLKKTEDEEIWKTATFVNGFHGMLLQLEQIASHHEVIGEQLKKEVASFAGAKALQHRGTRKQIMTDLARVHNDLNDTISEMNKAHKLYSKSFKEAEVAYVKYVKADKNMEISRLELEKAKTNSHARTGLCEETKQIYFTALKSANEQQETYFDTLLPMIYDKFKGLDKERIEDSKDLLTKCIQIENDMQRTIDKCREKMYCAVEHIDAEADATYVIENIRACISRPASFILEDLGLPEDTFNKQTDEVDGAFKKSATLLTQHVKKDNKKGNCGIGRKRTIKTKLFGTTNSSKVPDDDYSDLPSKQRARKLTSKIVALEKELEKTMQSRDGLSRLQNAYRENGKLGNPSDLDGPLIEHAKEIEALRQRHDRCRLTLSDVEAAILQEGDVRSHRSGTESMRSSMSSISLSLGACSSGMSSRANTIERPNSREQCFHDNESAKNNSGGVSGDSGSVFREEFEPFHSSPPRRATSMTSPLRSRQISFPMLRSSSALTSPSHSSPMRLLTSISSPVTLKKRADSSLGSGVAQFSFEGTTYGTISMTVGEELYILEKDEGDGWTKVKRLRDEETGFVPTSYIECTWN